jgi:hypothetical protein
METPSDRPPPSCQLELKMRQHFASLVLLSAVLVNYTHAQDPRLMNETGTPYPMTTVEFPVSNPTYMSPLALAPDGKVFAMPDVSLPSGLYAFDVVDLFFNSLSHLTPDDRIFELLNNGDGTFSVTRVSGTPGLPSVGVGLTGGDSIPVFPFSSPAVIEGRPELTCVQKLMLHSVLPSGELSFVGYRHFRVGDGSPGTLSGVVFNDQDRDGVRGPNDHGIAGCTVKLVSNAAVNPGLVVAVAITNSGGGYLFDGVGTDDCSVVLELDQQIYQATTPLDVRLNSCGCGSQIVDFGKFAVQTQCAGHTPGFWRNNNGVALIQGELLWDELRGLNLVDFDGADFDPSGAVQEWRGYLTGGNAQNMSYMLSIHLAAMQLNILSGNVSSSCLVQTPTGPATIQSVVVAANAVLAADGFTPTGDPNRAVQELLKNILDAANNNQNWL